jgi:transcriptional regulator with PAS, ATPase and Fis domain
VACAQSRVITEEDLSEGFVQVPEGVSAPAVRKAASLKDAIEDLERQLIAHALRCTGNNQQQAAKALGLSRQGLVNKVRRYHLGSPA